MTIKKKRGRPKKDIDNQIILLRLNIDVNKIIESLRNPSVFNNFTCTTELEAYEENNNFLQIDNDVKEKKINTDKKYNVIVDDDKTVTRVISELQVKHKDCLHKSKWPVNSDYCCYWCSHKFTNVPVYIPTKYEDEVFHVYGNFCSFNCALSYNYNSQNYKFSEQSSLLHLLYKKMFGEFKNIKYAPPKESLKMYGGKLSIDEYRKNFDDLNKTYSIIYPPFKSLIPQLEESKVITTKSSFNNINTTTTSNSELLLKRSKPVNKKKNTLSSFISYK